MKIYNIIQLILYIDVSMKSFDIIQYKFTAL